MYWSWSRHRSFGGEMLKIVSFLFLFSSHPNAFACWRASGKFSINGNYQIIDQKISHGKEYSISLDDFLMNFRVTSKDKFKNIFRFEILRKDGIQLEFILSGRENLIPNEDKKIVLKNKLFHSSSELKLKLSHI